MPPKVRKLIKLLGSRAGKHLHMVLVYEDEETRALALTQESAQVISPQKSRKMP